MTTTETLLGKNTHSFPNVPVHQLFDQSASLTNVRSLTTRFFTPYEQAQNHCQVGNFGLAMRTIIGWMESLQARDEALVTPREATSKKEQEG